MSKHIVLISYNFPPLVGVGSMRVQMLAKGLARLGYRVSVLTVLDPPGGEIDGSGLDEYQNLVDIYRAKTKEPMFYVQQVKKVLNKKHTQDNTQRYVSGPNSQRLNVPIQLKRLVQSFYIPDEKISWAYEAYKLGLSLNQQDSIDLIISSGPPHSAHVCGTRLAKAMGKPYILDLRDPWFTNMLHNSKGTSKKQWKLESEAFLEADALVSLTPGLVSDLSSRYPKLAEKLYFIPNAAKDNRVAYKGNTQAFTICYTGNLQGTQNLDRIYRAIEEISEEDGFDLSTLHFNIVGNIEDKYMPQSSVCKPLFSFVGPKTANEVFEYQATSDALLYIHGLEKQYQLVLGAKFAEYLRASRPIIGLCQKGSDAACELKKLGHDYLAQPYSVPEIKSLLKRLILDRKKLINFSYTPQQEEYIRSKYSEQAFIESYSKVIKTLVG